MRQLSFTYLPYFEIELTLPCIQGIASVPRYVAPIYAHMQGISRDSPYRCVPPFQYLASCSPMVSVTSDYYIVVNVSCQLP